MYAPHGRFLGSESVLRGRQRQLWSKPRDTTGSNPKTPYVNMMFENLSRLPDVTSSKRQRGCVSSHYREFRAPRRRNDLWPGVAGSTHAPTGDAKWTLEHRVAWFAGGFCYRHRESEPELGCQDGVANPTCYRISKERDQEYSSFADLDDKKA